MGNDPELYVMELKEIINGYVVLYGRVGEEKEEFVERRIDALELMLSKIKEEYSNEAQHLFRVVKPGPVAGFHPAESGKDQEGGRD